MPPFEYGRDPRMAWGDPRMMGWGMGPRMGRHCGGPHRRRALRIDEEVAVLESYQRDLEQELADVVERLRRLRKAAADDGSDAGGGNGTGGGQVPA